MQFKEAVPFLLATLENESMPVIVRHEASESLGAIGDDSAIAILEKYLDSEVSEISETCKLAVDRIRWLKVEEM